MSILIKGMEMPKNCNECPLHFYEGQGICCCRALPAIDDGEILKPWKNRRKDCPLISVSPHGRLIDADAFLALCREYTITPSNNEFCKYLEYALTKAPTIIPAEEG